jgi:hypothetical protein
MFCVAMCVQLFISLVSLPLPTDGMDLCVVLFLVYQVAVSDGYHGWMWVALFYVLLFLVQVFRFYFPIASNSYLVFSYCKFLDVIFLVVPITFL